MSLYLKKSIGWLVWPHTKLTFQSQLLGGKNMHRMAREVRPPFLNQYNFVRIILI
jgi:hypothetical protein